MRENDEKSVSAYQNPQDEESGTKELEPENAENSGKKGGHTRRRKARGKARGPQAKRGQIRDRIREIAREEFIKNGYDGTTIREVARQAGCDSAMVSYYFGAKQRLFRDCFNLPLDPAELIFTVLAEGPQGAGERMIRQALNLYEEQITADTMRILMTSLLTDVTTSQRFRNYVRHEILEILQLKLGAPPQFAEEIELAISTLYGFATMRYIVELEPIASMPTERVVRELAPVLQYRVERVFAMIQRSDEVARRAQPAAQTPAVARAQW